MSVIEQLVSRDLTVLDGLPDKARSVLAELTALARARPREGGLTRHMVIGAIRRLLRAASDDGGVMLVIDDVHLADDATVEACAHLARSGSGFPFLVVLAYRAEGARPALTQGVAGLARAGRSVGIDVGPLDPDDVVVLASAGAPTKPDDKVLTQIVASAQGNPFVALELARTVVAGRPFAVSPSVWEAVTGRFLDLGDAFGGVLCRLAVAGDDLDPVSVPALTGLSEPEAFTLLDAALAAGALIVSGARYRFGHELIRQALLRQIPPHQRIAMHREAARRLAAAGAAPGLVARQWLDGGRPHEAVGWLVVAARRAVKLGAFADALVHLDTALDYAPQHEDALCLRAEVLDALGDLRAPTAYAAAAQVVDEPASHDLRAKQAPAELKLGDPPRALRTLEGSEPVSVEGRLAQALTLSGAAALGFADPELGTAKAAESRRLALASGDTAALVVASWAQAAAAHARGDLRASVRAALRETQALRDLAISVFDGQLCITQRLLYGARPYPDVIAFADSLTSEAQRLGAARGHAFAVTLRGEANLLSGRLDQADNDLTEAARLNRAIGAAVGEALALQRRAEVALHRGRSSEALALLDEALAVARESDVGFHLLDRIYGTKITAATDSPCALAALEESEAAVRGPLETCPGCRITLAVPAAIAAARAGDLDRANRYEEAAEMLANVVMCLPAWDAALEEVKGHRLLASGTRGAADRFRAAAEGFQRAGQPLDEARCAALRTVRPDCSCRSVGPGTSQERRLDTFGPSHHRAVRRRGHHAQGPEEHSGRHRIRDRHRPTPRRGPHRRELRAGRHSRGGPHLNDRVVKSDQPPMLGGDGHGPNPVEISLAALGACQAQTYRFWSEKLGIRIDDVAVDVQGNVDVQGIFGLRDGVRPGFRDVSVAVPISGPESPERYDELRRAVDDHCPVLDVFANPVPVATSMSVY